MAGQVGRLEMKVFRNDMKKLRYLHVDIMQELHEVLPRIGAKLEATILRHMQNQDLKWEPLSEEYKKWKESHDYSTNTWIMTSSLQQAITSTVNKSKLMVFVGVHRTAGNHELSNQPLYEIAFALEFGTRDVGGHIPERPLFQPSLEENKRSVETSVGIAVKKALKKFNERMSSTPTP